ncbi:MAG: hypothetical protein N3D10_03735 [Candidatus Micrarchaeota archaeon]|nr:hypothetical protein [Candidatus Micrarchaeota archaeon]
MNNKKLEVFIGPFLVGFLALLWLAAEYGLISTTIPIGPFALLVCSIILFWITKKVKK